MTGIIWVCSKNSAICENVLKITIKLLKTHISVKYYVIYVCYEC